MYYREIHDNEDDYNTELKGLLNDDDGAFPKTFEAPPQAMKVEGYFCNEITFLSSQIISSKNTLGRILDFQWLNFAKEPQLWLLFMSPKRPKTRVELLWQSTRGPPADNTFVRLPH